MNKKFQQFIPICLILAGILIIIIIVMMCKPKIEQYGQLRADYERKTAERQELEAQAKKAEADRQAHEIKLKQLKPIFESEGSSNADNLSIFGSMFDDIIKTAQSNGLLIRSIEYKMNPENDIIVSTKTEEYSVCELKFYFVATYSQLLAFLNDMNNNFKYLTSVSSLTVAAFEENTDYLLIKESINLYTKKIDKNAKK